MSKRAALYEYVNTVEPSLIDKFGEQVSARLVLLSKSQCICPETGHLHSAHVMAYFFSLSLLQCCGAGSGDNR